MKKNEDLEAELEEEEDEDKDAEDTQEVPVHKAPSPLRVALTNSLGRFCVRYLPFMIRACKFGNQHWWWQRLCLCGYGVTVRPDEKGGWHGGVYDMQTGHELVPCAHCYGQMSPGHHQWALTQEEEEILDCWRSYRMQILDEFEGVAPYKYEINVKLNDAVETFLISRTEGIEALAGSRGMLSDTTRTPKKGADKPN